MTYSVAINGANGKMGQTTCEWFSSQAVSYKLVGKYTKSDDLSLSLKAHQPDIVIELTNADVVYENTCTILNAHCHAVVGSSGLTEKQLPALDMLAKENNVGCLVVPNFSLGAVMMMKLASMAAQVFTDVEIIETHHEKKLDAPSGTAIKTAQMISGQQPFNKHLENERSSPARGLINKNIPVHAVRLPGFVASQKVIFGAHGEHLIIEHNSINRECFMPGIVLACDKVVTQIGLTYGLEQFI